MQPYRPQWKPRLGARINWRHPLARGIVGYWPMNDGGGLKVSDLGPYHNTGTLSSSSAKWSTTRTGCGINFGGTGSPNIVVPATTDYDVPSAGSSSYCVWFKTTTTSSLIFQGQGNTGNPLVYLMIGATTAAGTANKFNAYIRTNANVALIPLNGVTTVTDGNWHLGCLTIANALCTLYIDGKKESSGSLASNNGINFSPATMEVGSNNANGYAFVGPLDGLMIYNRALSLVEIEQLYKTPFCFLQQRYSYPYGKRATANATWFGSTF